MEQAKLSKTRKYTELIRALIDRRIKDSWSEIQKARLDVIQYGEGTIKIDDNGNLEHIPYQEVIKDEQD